MLKLVMMKTELSVIERDLIRDMESLRVGELLYIEVPDHPEAVTVSSLTSRQRKLIQLIQSGIRAFDRIIVQDGDPVEAFVSFETKGGFSAIRHVWF